MLRHIQICTVAEAQRHLKSTDWFVTLKELEAAIAIFLQEGYMVQKIYH